MKLLLPRRRAIRTSTVLPTRYCVSRETELLDRPVVSRNIEACARWMFKWYSGRGSSTHLSSCLFPGEKNAGNFSSWDFQRENAAVPGRRLDRYETKENEPSYRYATVKWVSLRFVFLFDKIPILLCVFFLSRALSFSISIIHWRPYRTELDISSRIRFQQSNEEKKRVYLTFIYRWIFNSKTSVIRGTIFAKGLDLCIFTRNKKGCWQKW